MPNYAEEFAIVLVLKKVCLMTKEFLIGLINGMASPFTSISPDPIQTHVAEELKRSSYIPPSEDMRNIARDFSKVIEYVRPEISATEKKSIR